MNRRYHSSPSIPFLIANAEGVQMPAGSPVDSLKGSSGTSGAPAPQTALETPEIGLRVFLWCLWIAGLSVGAGLALELSGMMHQGLFAQAFGFFVAGVAIIRKPDGE